MTTSEIKKEQKEKFYAAPKPVSSFASAVKKYKSSIKF